MIRTLPYIIDNTLQTPKYLRTGNVVEFLTENQNLQQILYHQDQDRSSKQLYTSEPGVRKMAISLPVCLLVAASHRYDIDTSRREHTGVLCGNLVFN
jgi:hypothetical protein